MHRHLRAAARFTGDALNQHLAAGDFRHFHLKQALDQIRMRTADAHLRAAAGRVVAALHFQHIDFQVVTHVDDFAGNHLIAFEVALGAAHQLHHSTLVIHARNDGRQDFVFLIGVLFIHTAAFCVAQALHNDALSGLGSDAQEIARRHVRLHNVAHLVGVFNRAGFLQRNLVGGLLHFFDNQAAGIHMNFTRRAVNGRGNVVGGGFCLALGAVLGIRLFQRILDRGEKHILAQILLLAQRADGFHEFFVLWICFRRSSCLGLSHDCVTLQ